ncbi:MAG: M14 family metallocarboxypeptidase [Alphaproteobacteria bacterium]|nr:M14 family metallocarboxypeptidase [Alphaproteobacteria bacterium]
MRTYPIGTPGRPWGEAERAAWRARQAKARSYGDLVITRIDALSDRFEVDGYGVLEYPEGRYPLYGLRSRGWSNDRPTALVTGGVHGYETSGVLGALAFADQCGDLAGQVDLAIAPCVSPWAFEVVNRWNPEAVDPNRSFMPDSPAAECRALMAWVAGLGPLALHIDLHETTDSDNTEFRPAKAARDGVTQTEWNIPDGFYLVDRSDRPVPAFQAYVRDRVEAVTHIAEADPDGRLIGVPLQQRGVIEYDARGLGLCTGMTDAPYTATTEVYPDSPRTDPETCVRAQVAAVRAAVEAVLAG